MLSSADPNFRKCAMEDGSKRNQMSNYFTDITEQICSMGNGLHHSSLLSQIKILDRLIYKYKNQHGREKYFQGLEKMKKSLNRWKTLSLDKKLIEASKHIRATGVDSSDHLKYLLTELMHGGKLVIRNIVLCQETVQILLKDFWCTLVECYQLVRLFVQNETSENTLNKFPECLTSWLSDDLKDVLMLSRNVAAENSYSGLNAVEMLEKLRGKGLDDEVSTNSLWEEYHNLDLGEPVQDLSEIKRCGNFYPTPKASKRVVSDFRKSLGLKFDMELVVRRNLKPEEGSAQTKEVPTSRNSRDSGTTAGLSATEFNLGDFRKSCWISRRRRTLHQNSNHIVWKKHVSRYCLKTLATMNVNCNLTSKNILGLLAIMRYLLSSELPPTDRKILLKTKRIFQRKLKSREFQENNRVRQGTETGVPRTIARRIYRDMGGISHRVKDTLSIVVGKGISWKRNSTNSSDCVDLKSGKKICGFRKPKDEDFQPTDSKRDEIDDIFSSLGL